MIFRAASPCIFGDVNIESTTSFGRTSGISDPVFPSSLILECDFVAVDLNPFDHEIIVSRIYYIDTSDGAQILGHCISV